MKDSNLFFLSPVLSSPLLLSLPFSFSHPSPLFFSFLGLPVIRGGVAEMEALKFVLSRVNFYNSFKRKTNWRTPWSYLL